MEDNSSILKKINKNLEEVKKLLILQLLTNGVTSEIVGKTLSIDASSVRHMVSTKNIGKRKHSNDDA